jgi:hypothetical protein
MNEQEISKFIKEHLTLKAEEVYSDNGHYFVISLIISGEIITSVNISTK